MAEPDENDPLEAITSIARMIASTPAPAGVERQSRYRVMARASLACPRPRTGRRAAALLAAAAIAAAAAVWLLPRKPLSYEVKGAVDLGSPYISAPTDAPVDVVFSDGSDVHADPGTHLRIDETGPRGARLVVERGTALAQVRHRERSTWRFVAGPFEVRVTGTRVGVAWDASKEEFDLRVYEGSVEVTSPLGGGSIPVRAGQRYHAALPTRSMSLLESGEMVPAVPTASRAASGESQEAPSASPDDVNPLAPPSQAGGPFQAQPVAPIGPIFEPGINGGGPARRVQASGRADSWSDLVARGEYQAVVAAAESRGVETCVASCTATELRALADSARYAGRSELAEKCLLAIRRRFRGSEENANAAFLLGRLAETRGQLAPADRWYETYLAESPRGPFAAEALAGSVRAVMATRGAGAAKPLAFEYLRRYPDGVHAKALRKIAGTE